MASFLYTRLLRPVGDAAFRRWYEYLSSVDSGRHLLFMNFGYQDLESGVGPDLRPEDEPDRQCIQLYHHLASAAGGWHGVDALEVGCGRGGGASYIARYMRPASMTGLDLAYNAIAFCRRHYAGIEGLRFEQGDAQALPFDDASFDLVMNVESSNCYPRFADFLREVERVLRPGGMLLHADYRHAAKIDSWRESLRASKLVVDLDEDITANVVRSLEIDNERKERLIRERAPAAIRGLFRRFAGVRGTAPFYGAFAQRRKVYRFFRLSKPISKVASGQAEAALHDPVA